MKTVEEIRVEASGLLRNGYLSLDELWLTFRAHGGTASMPDLAAFVHGLMQMTATDLEFLCVALSKVGC